MSLRVFADTRRSLVHPHEIGLDVSGRKTIRPQKLTLTPARLVLKETGTGACRTPVEPELR